MKKHNIQFIVLLLAFLTLFSSCSKRTVETTASTDTSTASSAETTVVPSTSPIPTYAPGTELYGMLSVTGEIIIEPKYEYLNLFSEEGFALFCDHGLWGYVNLEGEEIIPAQYEDANNFSEGLAAVKVNGKWGFIDTTGKMVISTQFEDVQDGFIHGRCVYSEGSRKGLINMEGNIVLEPSYFSITLYSQDYFIVTGASSSGEQYGLIDKDGNIVVDLQGDEIYAVTDSGFYFTGKTDTGEYDVLYDIFERFPAQYVDSWSAGGLRMPYMEASCPVSVDGMKWGAFDAMTGEYIIDPIYEKIELAWGDGYIITYSENTIDLYNFETGETVASVVRPEKNITINRTMHDFIVFTAEDSWEQGVMDMSGTVIASARYYEVALTPNGEFAVFQAENNCSYILNAKGEVLSVYEGMALIEYITSFDCWLYSSNYSYPGLPTYGLMKSDGEIWYEPFTDSLRSYDLDRDCVWLQVIQGIYHRPERSPVIYATDYMTESGRLALGTGILSATGISEDMVYSRLEWLPNQEIIVVTEKDGDMGIVAWDGAIILEPWECEIKLEDEGSSWLFIDTEYLVFSEKAT